MNGAKSRGRACWWCGTAHTGRLAYEWGDRYPTWIWPDPPPRDHDHSVIPPTADELVAGARRIAERIADNLTTDGLVVEPGRTPAPRRPLAAAERVIRDSSALVDELRHLRVDTRPLAGLFDTRPPLPAGPVPADR